MLNFKPYFYYSKTDPDKEVIDRIVAASYEAALEFFAERKKINQYIFTELYEIESK